MSTKKTIGGIIAAILILVISNIAGTLPASLLYMLNMPEWICNITAGISYLVIAYLLIRLLVTKILKISMEDMGMPKFSVKPRFLIMALILPVAVTLAFILFVNGAYISSGINGEKAASCIALGILYTGMAAGFAEEMLFRGIILNLIRNKWNTVAAVIIPSVLFGAIHLTEVESFTATDAVLLIIAGTAVGTLFSVIAIRSGSVWNGAVVHSIWNIIMIGGILQIGSTPSETSILSYVINDSSSLLTGGTFGVESSVIAMGGYLLAAIAALLMTKKKVATKA